MLCSIKRDDISEEFKYFMLKNIVLKFRCSTFLI